jgi:hypothetical protein
MGYLHRYDNIPDEPAIWYENVFSKKEKDGTVTIYAAYRVTFEGNDARDDAQRISPKISNVQFIFEKGELKKIGDRLRSFPEWAN